MSKSMQRVEAAARANGLAIEVRRMAGSTRTAQEAARQCGCDVAQIVKSLVFQGQDTGACYLFLVPGDRQLDLDKAAQVAGEVLARADADRVRQATGFAIGGVAPLGHLTAVRVYADRVLLAHAIVWAAAGAPNAVFAAEPGALCRAARAGLAALS